VHVTAGRILQRKNKIDFEIEKMVAETRRIGDIELTRSKRKTIHPWFVFARLAVFVRIRSGPAYTSVRVSVDWQHRVAGKLFLQAVGVKRQNVCAGLQLLSQDSRAHRYHGVALAVTPVVLGVASDQDGA
jgi:hypothetical protein